MWSILSLTERLADFLPKLLTSDDRPRRELLLLLLLKHQLVDFGAGKGGATAGRNNNKKYKKKSRSFAFLCSCCRCCCRSSTCRCLYKLTRTIRMNGRENFYRRLFFLPYRLCNGWRAAHLIGWAPVYRPFISQDTRDIVGRENFLSYWRHGFHAINSAAPHIQMPLGWGPVDLNVLRTAIVWRKKKPQPSSWCYTSKIGYILFACRRLCAL